MSNFSLRLKELRISKQLTQQKLADLIGVSKSSINMYERGTREPGLELLESLADFFNVDLDYIMGKVDIPRSNLITNSLNSPEISNNFSSYPIIGEIAAGFDVLCQENWTGDMVEIPDSYLKGHAKGEFFVLRVKGDSMYPLYHDNDLVLVLKQSTVRFSGDIGVILYDDEYATLKKIEYTKNKDWLKLVPINPTFAPVTVEKEQLNHCHVLGIPKLLIRNVN